MFPTPYAGADRIRFEGLRSPALSAPDGAPLSYAGTPYTGWHTGCVIMRLLRGRRPGDQPTGPSLLTRVLALLVVLGMVLLVAPGLGRPLGAGLRWLADLLF